MQMLSSIFQAAVHTPLICFLVTLL
jgi:hypothetical protein